MIFLASYLFSYLLSYFKILLPILLIVFAVMGGLNSNIEDFNSYYEIYSEVPSFDILIQNFTVLSDIYGENGYLIYNSIIKLFIDDYYMFRVITLLITLFIIFYVYKKTSYFLPIVFLFYFTEYFYLHTIALRTSIATALILLSFYTLENRQYFRTVALFILASSFHLVASLSIIIYLVYMYVPFKKLIFLMIIIFSIVISKIGLVTILTIFFDTYFSHTFISLKLNAMANGSISYSSGILRGTVILHMLFLTLFFSLFEKLNTFKYFKIFFISYLISFVFLLIFNDMSIVGDRLFIVFSIPLGILFSYVLYCFNDSKVFILGSLSIIFMILMYLKGINILPYEFMNRSV